MTETSTRAAGGLRAESGGTRLDATAKRIIELLQVDGRASYATIAKAVGLSEAGARARVQKLMDNDVMQVVAVTDPVQVGFARQAMIGVRSEGDPRAVGDRIAELPEVDYVVTTAGSFDALVEVVCENDDHLLEILRQIREVPGVLTTETFVYLKLNKQHYNWGTR
ncbi:MAG: Lrp/AsnC family transcriptional regulator [Nocardioides sp.]|uniref:Lrp/AsnC family transcriptional regulator n=1 Tax=Nocardioides sp. TaxID=35761 RepID=UPI003F0EAC4C